MASTRAIRRSSTHGPFLLERLTCQLPLALAATAATDDVAVGRLVLLAGPVAQRRDAPRGDRVTARGGGPLAAAVRVVDGVHRRAARLRAHPQVALAAGLADLDVLVVGVADRAHGRPAVRANHAHLADGRRRVAVSPSLAMSWMPTPAERPSCPPRPGCSSTLWTTVPVGMFASGSALPTVMSAPGPLTTVIPTTSRFGARM